MRRKISEDLVNDNPDGVKDLAVKSKRMDKHSGGGGGGGGTYCCSHSHVKVETRYNEVNGTNFFFFFFFFYRV